MITASLILTGLVIGLCIWFYASRHGGFTRWHYAAMTVLAVALAVLNGLTGSVWWTAMDAAVAGAGVRLWWKAGAA